MTPLRIVDVIGRGEGNKHKKDGKKEVLVDGRGMKCKRIMLEIRDSKV